MAVERQPLVLLPGLLCDRALWQPQLSGLADVAEMTVADLTRRDSADGMAADVLRDAPPRFALAGLSMGGYIALTIMRMAPERVTRLALLDTTARADTPERTRARELLIAQARVGQFKGISPRLLPEWIHPSRLNDTALTQAVIDMAGRVGRDAFIRQQTAIMGRIDSRPGLSHIDCPTLVVCGRQDRTTPVELATEIAADIPSSRLVIIEECGHLSTLERPEAVNAAMRAWLIAE